MTVQNGIVAPLHQDGEKRQLRSVATGTRRQIVLWNVGLVLFIGGVFSVAGWVVYDASLDHGQVRTCIYLHQFSSMQKCCYFEIGP